MIQTQLHAKQISQESPKYYIGKAKTNKFKFEKPVRQTAFQKLQSVQSIVIFFNFVRPSLPFLDVQRCRRFRLVTQRRQKRLLQYAFENLLARLIQF